MIVWQMLCIIVSLADVFAWQMLFTFLECGRCYCQEEDVVLLFFVIDRCYCHIFCGRCCTTFCIMLQHVVLADVIAKWQMEWPLQVVVVYHLVDVIPRGQMDVHGCTYFSFSSEVLCRMSSHM